MDPAPDLGYGYSFGHQAAYLAATLVVRSTHRLISRCVDINTFNCYNSYM